MAKTINLRGTSELQFRIGITGPTVYQGTGAPSGVTPLADGLKNGDVYIRTGAANQGLFVYDSAGVTWNQLTSTGGSQVFSGDVTVQGEFDTDDHLVDINNGEVGSGISAPGGQAGIAVNRGVLDAVSWVFDETNDWWQPVSTQNSANSVYVPYHLIVGSTGATFNAGLAGTPSVHFSGDTDTGIFSPSPGFIGFTNNGSLSWSINNTGNLIPDNFNDIGNASDRVGDIYTLRTLHDAGSAGNPSISFYNDDDTGMYNGGADIISFATDGTPRLHIRETGRISTFAGYESLVNNDEDIPNKKYVDDAVSGATLSFPILAPAGTPGAPPFSFSTATTTGMYLNGTSLGFSNGSLNRLDIQSNGILVVNTPSYETLATGGDDIPNRTLVENLIAGISWKEPAIVKDDTIYANLATAEAAMNGGTVDGVGVVNGSRILYRNITGSPRDIYRILGTPGAGATLVQVVSSAGAAVYIVAGTSAGELYAFDGGSLWAQPNAAIEPYDVVGQAFGTVSDATVFTIFKAVRTFSIDGTGHDGYAITAPSGGAATITVSVNGISIGTLTFNNASNTLSSETIPFTVISAGDRIEFTLTTGNSIQDFSVTLLGYI